MLYAISVDDARTVSRVEAMVKGKGWDYIVLLDENNELKRKLGANTVPQTFIIKDNKILYRHSGFAPGAEDQLYAKLIQLHNKE